MDKRLYALILTLCFLVLSAYGTLTHAYGLYGADKTLALRETLMSALLCFVYAYVWFYTISLHRISLYLLMPFSFLLGVTGNYFISTFGITLNADMIAVSLEASGNEIKSFYSLTLIGLQCVSLLLAGGCARLYGKTRSESKDFRFGFITGIFVFFALFEPDANMSRNIPPFSTMVSMMDYYASLSKSDQVRYDFADVEWSFTAPKEPLTVMLVIGESARSSHFSLNGYHRKTNPLLEKEKNLVSFSDVTACATLTRNAIPCLLTRATKEKRELADREVSLIHLFREMGFQTHWLGVQGTESFIDAPYLPLLQEAHSYLFANKHIIYDHVLDETLLPYVDQLLEKHHDQNQLIVFHSIGSHWPYTEYYPKRFEKFTPVCGDTSLMEDFFHQAEAMQHCAKENKQALINAYDNSILYTDWLLTQMISKLKHRNAFMLYVSDHGESLGENGVYLHGHKNAPEQWHIPMIWWASDAFLTANKTVAEATKKKQHERLTHAAIFHSLLDCASIDSHIVNETQSLCD